VVNLVAPALDWSIPFRIDREDALTGARIGGRAPEGCSPPSLGSAGRFLVTVPLAIDPDLEASVFVGFTFQEMLRAAGDIDGGSRFVDVVVHQPSRRRDDSAYSSKLPGHALVLGMRQPDTEADPDGPVARSSHKLGGTPFIMRGGPTLDQAIQDLIEGGFRQVLQLDFPGADDFPVQGSWPFADGVFHLLGRQPFSAADWRAFWET